MDLDVDDRPSYLGGKRPQPAVTLEISAHPAHTESVGLQARIEASVAGQFAISILVAFIVCSIIGWNLPSSALKSAFTSRMQPVMYSTGLTQSWGMFAPDPPACPSALSPR
jgi:hypothetical protein